MLMLGMVLTNLFMNTVHRLTSTFNQLLLFLIIVLFFFSIAYGIILRWINKYLVFFYIQFLIDLLVISFAVHVTGGSSSGYTALFLIAIVGASIIDKERGALISSAAATTLFLLVSFFGYYRHLPVLPEQIMAPWEVSVDTLIKNITINIAAFWAVALMAAHLGKLLHNAGQEATAQKTALEELSAHHEKILRFINSGIVSTDIEGRIISINKAAAKILGCRKEEALAQSYRNFIPKIEPSEDIQKISLQRKDGFNKIIEISEAFYHNNKGEKQGSIFFIIDRTKMEKMEQEIQKNEKLSMLGRFAASIAHEIRNPLASMSGAIELLQQSSFPKEDDAKLMNILLREIERLDLLITDILLFAKPYPLQITTVEIEKVLSHTIQVLRQKRETPQIKLNRMNRTNQASENSSCNHEQHRNEEIAEQPSKDNKKPSEVAVRTISSSEEVDSLCSRVMVKGDENKLQQVFLNLLINAMEATGDQGSIHIQVEKKENSAEVCIEDNGKGIEPENLQKIFEPFFTTKQRGTGLGLSIVYQIIKDHQGTIQVESTKGKGTTFKVSLPLSL